MRLRRARALRLLLALTNLVAALTAIGVGACLLLVREKPSPPPRPLPVTLPIALPADFADFTTPTLDFKGPRPEPVRPSAYEDLQILIDAPTDFEARYRVLLASLEKEPQERTCIIEARQDGGDHRLLALGDRIGSWLLLAIDPVPTSPRSVRLRFRDLRRGEDIVTVLAPDL